MATIAMGILEHDASQGFAADPADDFRRRHPGLGLRASGKDQARQRKAQAMD